MSEEVTYAHLKFSASRKTEHIQEPDTSGTKACPACSYVWRPTALMLTVVCLLLLIGLAVVGSIFYTTLKTEKEKLNALQNVKEELQRNLSLQLIANINKSENIRNLSITLQNFATKLCRELNKKEPGHKCKPCPNSWIWYKNNCYFFSEISKTWQESERSCSAQNASLLQTDDNIILEFVDKRSRVYWMGLSPKQDHKNSEEVDENIISSARHTININEMQCRFYPAMEETQKFRIMKGIQIPD
ncbi:C-type lectin domain family 12 member A isoform X2 [Octodon degus]|uniref:C-type lectin domain family 12 member A isoform X2 n=1 Tax=Octodon degus TaxID=10160 RepID=A0A6P6DSV6_OCTDE|nr:C-type lectin domain family 12 member A isoform X2 [Octodon degus]